MYFGLEGETRKTKYAASIKLFQQVKNGKGALKSIKDWYTGPDKWQTKLVLKDKFLHSAEWKGWLLFPLKRLIG
eukprot:2335468-Ditylum_brightwellii.AAC.1